MHDFAPGFIRKNLKNLQHKKAFRDLLEQEPKLAEMLLFNEVWVPLFQTQVLRTRVHGKILYQSRFPPSFANHVTGRDSWSISIERRWP